MAIINNAHRGSQINLLCLIYRVLRRSKYSVTVDEIMNICRPESLLRKPDHEKRFSGEIQFWKEEGHQLWTIDEGGVIELKLKTESENPSPIEISDVTRSALFSKSIDDIMGENKNDIESLLRTLACVLASGICLPLVGKTINKQELGSLLDEVLLPEHSLNDSEKPTLLEYGQFLGFFEPYEGEYVVDPIRSVFALLPAVFSSDKSIAIKNFVEKLGGYIPIIDGGNYQEQVKRTMVERGWIPQQENNISKALSHALERLRLAKIIRFEDLSDDPNAMQLQLPNKQQQSVSSITFLKG